MLTLVATFLIISGSVLAQGVPQSFKYQAVIRKPNGQVLKNKEATLRISIIQDINSSAVYQELHEVTTNDFGLVNLNIGWGDVLTGDFSTIEWEQSGHFLGVEVSIYNNGQGAGPFIQMGTTQLLSVPYAFVAQKSIEGDADADPTNELNTEAWLNGTNLNITDSGGTVSVDLASLDESAEVAVAQASADVAQASADQATTAAAAAQVTIDTHVLTDGDIDSNNEIQNLNEILNEGNDAGGQNISNLGVVLATSFSGDGSGLTNINVEDSDSDPTNELQNWNNLPEVPADLLDGDDVDDADADPTNELQNWNNLPEIPADLLDGDDVDDADADPTNEIELPTNPQDGTIAFYNSGNWQVLTPGSNGQVLTLSNGLPVWAPTGTPLAIGDSYAGGIVFYLDGNGGGKVAANVDQGTSSWYTAQALIANSANYDAAGQAYNAVSYTHLTLPTNREV